MRAPVFEASGLVPMVLALALTSCGHSPPTAFFTLDPVPPAAAPPARVMAQVQLDAVHIPAALDRPELVTQIGPNRLAVSDLDHWAAPLGEMMRRALAQDLMARLPAGAFVPPGAPKPAGARGLVVTVLQLTAGPDGRVDMEANWTVLADGPAAAVSRNVRLSAAGPPGAAGEAGGIGRVLADLADRIAADLARS